MTENPEEQNTVRRYLLGNLSDEALMRRIEEKILLDDDFFEKLSISEDELIEEYLDGRLTEDEDEQFKRFFLISPERKEKLRLTENLRKYAAQYRFDAEKNAVTEKRFFDWQKIFSTAALRFAVIAFVVCGIGLGVWRIGFYESDANKGIAQLRDIYRSERPFESRLSNFEYAPFSATRGNGAAADKTLARDSAARKLLDAAQNKPGADSFHALGNYYLTEKQFDKAVAQFEAAIKSDPNNARVYNDYGVALLEKAKQISPEEQPGKRLENLARANEHFTKALEVNPSLLEAAFNRAITLQWMKLPDQTKKAWLDYLEKDSSSQWAEEARRNLQKLETEGASAKPPNEVLKDFFETFERDDEERAWQINSQTREMITDTMVFFQLTRGFLANSAAGQFESAEKYLAAMRFVGKMEKEKAGDPFFAELAEFYAQSKQPARRILLQSQDQIKKGYKLAKSSGYSEAIAAFRQSRETFDKTGNSWESKLSDYWIGFLHDRIGKTEQSAAEFLALKNYCREKNYKWLSSLAQVWLAEAAFNRNEFSKAINYSNAAMKITRENFDSHNQQKILANLGSYYSYLGEPQKALIQVEESFFREPNYFSSSRGLWRKCLFAAETFYKLKLHNTAISFGHEALHIGNEKISESTAGHGSYYLLGMLYGGSGKYSEAIDYAQKSLLQAQLIETDSKRLLTNYSLLLSAHLYRQSGNCEKSVEIYSEVVEETSSQTRGMSIELNNYEARKGRLLCYFSLNQPELIEEELPVVLNLYEKFRAQILEEQTRNAFFDNEQSVYDLAADFELSRKNSQKAFEILEKSKARSLLSLFQINDKELNTRLDKFAQPLPLSEIQNRLPEQAQIVQYAVLPDKILIWVITKTQFQLVERKIASAEISEQIENYLKFITENKLERKDSIEAHRLYENLIAPVALLLDPKKKLCFIPDKSLYRLPFAALVSPAQKRFLIENYAIISAPSATMLILSSEAAARKSGNEEEKILSIGNPYFDRREFPDLPDLPDAEKEAVAIAGYYQTAKTLTGKAADKKAFVQNLSGSDILHFAGHYAVNELAPMQSKLLLARTSEKQSADIEVQEILRQNLGSVKLAVLSACSTGTENYYNGEGMMGVARSFLARGVPHVIASQWAVDSDATAELMIKFHFYRKEHRLSSANALRRAQLDMLNNSNRRFGLPYYWAGFLPIGGITNY